MEFGEENRGSGWEIQGNQIRPDWFQANVHFKECGGRVIGAGWADKRFADDEAVQIHKTIAEQGECDWKQNSSDSGYLGWVDKVLEGVDVLGAHFQQWRYQAENGSGEEQVRRGGSELETADGVLL